MMNKIDIKELDKAVLVTFYENCTIAKIRIKNGEYVYAQLPKLNEEQRNSLLKRKDGQIADLINFDDQLISMTIDPDLVLNWISTAGNVLASATSKVSNERTA